MDTKSYQEYVFDEQNRSFKGEFEQMYKAEKTEGFDSWHQDDVNFTDKKLCLQILKQSNFNTIVDIGCGKGALTHLMKTKYNKVIGFDISQEAVSIAGNRYQNIPFFSMDIQNSDWKKLLFEHLDNMKSEGRVDCVVCLETLSYIEKWREVIKDFSLIGKSVLLKLFLPDDPIGYVKNGDEFVTVFNKYFNILEYIKFVNRKMIVIFGESKSIGEL